MATLYFHQDTNLWHAEGVDCGKGSITCSLTFSHSTDCSMAEVSVDGTPVGVIALSSYTAPGNPTMGLPGKDTDPAPIIEAKGEIDPVSGVHDITVRITGKAKVYDISFSNASPYPVTPYIPVPEKALIDMDFSHWEATDMLGRKMASSEDVRGARPDRKVGIFYWTWHEAHAHLRPVDVVDVLAEHPAAEYRREHPAWGQRPMQCFWHEPLYGFYRNSDPYIIRRHAVMLAAAGVDFLVFDCTNEGILWRDAYEPLLDGLRQARLDGLRTPQVAFLMNFGPQVHTEAMLRALYQNLYKPGLYSDLWFCLDGKPLMLAYPDSLPEKGCCDTDTRILNEIRDFFTFRPGQPGYGCGPRLNNQWSWMEIYPQNKYVTRPDGSCEMVSVGVAQNASDRQICAAFNIGDTYGRSYTHAHRFDKLTPDSYKYGYNAEEQWERALDIDPDHIFVTGWNEWIMGQWGGYPWLTDPNSTQICMVDQYDREHSRDIEPDKDGYLDTYYLQLAHHIRRYKGAPARPTVSPPQTIAMTGGATQWKGVTPIYRNPKGTTVHRNWDGFAGCHYVNDSGRNNIIETRVTRDSDHLYFFVKCAEPITRREACDENWMTLFLDTDRSKATGWEGYDVVINRGKAPAGQATVEAYIPTATPGSYTWKSIGRATLRIKGNTLTVAIPRALLNIDETITNPFYGTPMAKPLDFEFKWCDNTFPHGKAPDIMDFYRNGDTAPFGRFNYRYKE